MTLQALRLAYWHRLSVLLLVLSLSLEVLVLLTFGSELMILAGPGF
jgi:hypothetical protein